VDPVGGDQLRWSALRPLVTADRDVLEPALVVDLRKITTSADVAAARAGGRLLVGVLEDEPTPGQAHTAGLLDLTLAPEGCAADPALVEVPDPLSAAVDVVRRVEERPGPALTLGSVLRLVSEVDGPSGLQIESHAYSMLLRGADFTAWLDGRPVRRKPSDHGHDLVLVERQGDVVSVVLNHPERRNAYSARLRDELHEALRVAALDPSVRLVRLSGAGPGFCAGGDLDEFGTLSDPVLAHLIRTTAGVAGIMESLRPRLHVHVHGSNVGAGVELAAFGGRVTAAAGTTFALPEVTMGLMPGAGGTVSITRRVGRWRAAWLCLSGDVIDSDRACAWGLVDEVLS